MHPLPLVLASAAALVALPAAAQEAAALHTAVQAGDLAAVQLLLASPDAARLRDARDARGRTPLLVATALGKVDVARALILAGADVNAQDEQHDSPYLLAGAQGQLPILQLTLSHGANLRSTNRFGGTALIPAAERGHVDAVRALIAAGVDVDHVNRLGWTALLEAIVLSDGGPAHQEIVRQLIAAGANLQLPDRNGATPLALAEQRGHRAIAELLRAAGGQ